MKYSIVLASLACSLLSGIPDLYAEETASDERGAESPQAAFGILQASVAKDDWTTAFKVMTPRSRDFIVGGIYMACHLGAVGQEGKDLAVQHGDVSKLEPIIEELKKLPSEKQSLLAPKVSALVLNKSQFMSDALKLFAMKQMENWINALKDVQAVRLDRLKVADDSATAIMRFSFKNGEGSEETEFQRINGRWYFDYHRG